jgi:hypothetical protein
MKFCQTNSFILFISRKKNGNHVANQPNKFILYSFVPLLQSDSLRKRQVGQFLVNLCNSMVDTELDTLLLTTENKVFSIFTEFMSRYYFSYYYSIEFAFAPINLVSFIGRW